MAMSTLGPGRSDAMAIADFAASDHLSTAWNKDVDPYMHLQQPNSCTYV